MSGIGKSPPGTTFRRHRCELCLKADVAHWNGKPVCAHRRGKEHQRALATKRKAVAV